MAAYDDTREAALLKVLAAASVRNHIGDHITDFTDREMAILNMITTHRSDLRKLMREAYTAGYQAGLDRST